MVHGDEAPREAWPSPLDAVRPGAALHQAARGTDPRV